MIARRIWTVLFVFLLFSFATTAALLADIPLLEEPKQAAIDNPLTVTESKISKPLTEVLQASQWAEDLPIIIQFTSQPSASALQLLEQAGGTIKYRYTLIDAVALSIPAARLEEITAFSFVKQVELDAETNIVLAQSALQINAHRVWLEQGVEGAGVKVAVLDTGIDNEHEDLQNVILQTDFTGEGTDDENGHGTHVASIIAGSGKASAGLNKGIASHAQLMDVKVLNSQGAGRLSDAIAGIEYAALNDADIISLSLGAELPCTGLDAASLAADVAVKRGVIVVVAAGNLGPLPGTITSPGCAHDVITVGAVDKLDNIAVFSSRGPTLDGRTKPDIVAPGVLILAARAGGGYTLLSGTSMAAPHVSGVAALILSKNPGLSPEQVKTVLQETAKELGEDQNTQGAGRVDAYLAFTKASGLEPQPESQPEKEKEPEEVSPEDAEEKAREGGHVDDVKKIDEEERDGKQYYIVRGTKGNETRIIEVGVDKASGNIDFVEKINGFEALIRDVVRFFKALLAKLLALF